MSYLTRTTLDELAALTDELEINDSIIFSSEDPKELEYYKLNPCKYNMICKTNLLYEEYYVIVIGLVNGHNTIAKDIFILTNGNVNDEEKRIYAIKNFIEDYYEKYMQKNKNGYIYLVEDI